LKKRETVAVETQANFIRTFDIPEDVEPGTFNIFAKIIYANGKLAVSEHSFEVTEVKKHQNLTTILYYGFTVMWVYGLIFILIFKSRPAINRYKVRSRVARIVKKRLK